MIKYLFTILLSVIFIKSYACRCATTSLHDKFNHADFVATAKITEIQPDTLNKDFHKVTIEIINLYKGEKSEKLSILSMLNSSCAFYPDKNSTWLIFANTFKDVLSFGFCSGSIQIDKNFDETKYPGLTANYRSGVDLKISALNWIKDNKIDIQNKYQIETIQSKLVDELKGYKGENKDFAIIEYSLEKDFTLKNVKLIKKFNNSRLSNLLKKVSANDFKAYHKTLKYLPQPTKLFVIYYFYPEEGSSKSFISIWDV